MNITVSTPAGEVLANFKYWFDADGYCLYATTRIDGMTYEALEASGGGYLLVWSNGVEYSVSPR